MKTFIISGFLLTVSFQLFAQSGQIQYGSATFNGSGQVSSSSVEIEKAEKAMVAKRWSSYIKDFDGKVKNSKGEYFQDNTKMSAISPDTLDIYSRVEESGDNVVITVAINKNGEFINNGSGSYVAIDDMLLSFEKIVKKEKADQEYEEAAKALKTLERSLNELKDKNTKLASSIQDMKSDIADNERTIKSNDKSIEEMNSKIREQDDLVKSLKSKTGEYK